MSAVGMSEVSERLMEIASRWGSVQYELVHACCALDLSAEWALAGYPTPSHWIGDHFDVELSTAREWIRVGKAMQKFSLVDAAFRERQLSYSKVRTLTRFVNDENELELVHLATGVPAGSLNRALALWFKNNNDQDAVDDRQEKQKGFYMNGEPDGGWRIGGYLSAFPGAKVKAALLAQVMKNRKKNASADASLAQQYADALVSLITEGPAQVSTEVIIHVQGDGAFLDDGTPLVDSVVKGLVPDAFIRALVVNADKKPVNLSYKRRLPTERQRRFVEARDKRCVDCGSEDFSECDHVPDYEVTKHTTTDELVLRCSRCHKQRHRRQQVG